MNAYIYRRGSIFWALVLIGLGTLFLWHNFNPSVHPWELIAKFWPVLIIFWGVSKLIDYMQAQAHPESSAPSLFTGSEVVMLVLILLLGSIISRVFLHPWQQWGGWHIGDDEISNIFLNSYTYTKNLSQAVSASPQLVLDDQRGDVEVQGSDQPAVDVTAKETIRADDENTAKKISDALKLDLVEEAGHYTLQSNQNTMPDEGHHVTLDLNVRAPKAAACEVSTERGDITVDGLNGDQTLATQKGDVRASNIQGIVKIHKSGGSIDVRGIKGSVELEGHGGNIDVADVSDTVTVHGEFTGALEFRNVGQTLRFQSLRSDLTAQKLSGTLNMEVGSLDVNGIDGPLDVATRQKDITVNEFKHSVHITSNDGEVNLQTSTPPSHDIEVESKNGAVELTLPANSNFEITADSRHGEVECDFAGPGLKVVKEGDSPSITGSFGKGGPSIRIHTEYGAIRILRAGTEHESPHDSEEPSEHSHKAQTRWNHHDEPNRHEVRVRNKEMAKLAERTPN